MLSLGLLLFIWAAVTEYLDPTYVEQMGLTGRHLYAIPIGQKATAMAAEAACVERGLNLVTFSRSYPAPRDTVTMAWAGGCSSEAIMSFSYEFCGACSNNASSPSATNPDRCRNLAVWYGDVEDSGTHGKVAGNPGGVFSWDVSKRRDMKALCIEKDLKPENRVVLDSAMRRIPGMAHEDVPGGSGINHKDLPKEWDNLKGTKGRGRGGRTGTETARAQAQVAQANALLEQEEGQGEF